MASGHVSKDKKTNTYYYVLDLGKNAAGKRDRKKKRGFKKKGDALKALNEAIFKAENTLESEDNNSPRPTMLLKEYLPYWIENYSLIKNKPKTSAEYIKMINNHIIPALGKIRLNELTSLILQDYYNEKSKTLSARTVSHHHKLIRKCLNDAIRWQIITLNAASGANPPTPEEKEMETLNSQELKLLLEAAKEFKPIYYPAIATAVYTGMRVSEIIGLRWKDVDFERNKIYVHQTVTHSGGQRFFNRAPKGKKARSLTMGKEHRNLLLELYEEHNKRKKSLGDDFNPKDFVHHSSVGTVICPSELTRAFKESLRAANLKEVRFHDLRHSHATILFEKGTPAKVVSERLGHSKIFITLDTYTHLTESLENQAVSVLDELFY
ncbi:tyrosine-type recombinase/integrase [Mesobacillus foraminis]|uniref:tyrosine-type recombinase/integrase n=1 Tax=Mesobacillus foraminis TaxID=279826 RepID=UPI000EF457E3|nr:tyrosine-type recombinase/integrase [Mesobacillus foraminis]